ncbi:hypothetical protein ACV229_18320 [Burkholderia sp. MR1-5-21]
MNPISALRPASFALAALMLGGCYYTNPPYGYAPPYYVPATVAQTPGGTTAPDSTAAAPDASATVSPDVYAGPVYPPPYPYPYPYYYPPYYPGWYDCCWPPVAIGIGFGFGGGGHFHGHGGGGHFGHFGHPPMGGGHFGGGHGH